MDYKTYKEQQAQRSLKNYERKEVHFVSEFLKNDGDSIVVRFPYQTMDDIEITPTHTVIGVFPNNRWGKRVICSEDESCPLCKQGVKKENRFLSKMVVYDNSNGEIKLLAGIWDRPAAFADIEINGLMDEYGDLTDCLFKIKRVGTGTETRYTINPIINKTVYNPDVYVKDFSCLENVNPVVITTKTIAQYEEALNSDEKEEKKEQVKKEEKKEEKKEDLPWKEEPKKEDRSENFNLPEEVVEKEKPQPASTEGARKRYVF